MATTTSETTFRAVARDEHGASYFREHNTIDEAWADVDVLSERYEDVLADRKWVVQQTTTTTTTKDVAR